MANHHVVMNQGRMEMCDLLFLVRKQFGDWGDPSKYFRPCSMAYLVHNIKSKLH